MGKQNCLQMSLLTKHMTSLHDTNSILSFVTSLRNHVRWRKQRQCANFLPTIWLLFTLRGTRNISQIFVAGLRHVIISFLALQVICQHRRSLMTQIVEETLTKRRAMLLAIHSHLKQKHKCFYNSQQIGQIVCL